MHTHSRSSYRFPRFATIFALGLFLRTLAAPSPGTDFTFGPQPGDVYWEHVHVPKIPGTDWDTYIQTAYWYAKKFDITVPDLTHAVKAEISVEYWGGHIGTSGQRLVVNGDSTAPVYFPLPKNTPGQPECFYRNMNGNSSMAFPLEQLVDGENHFEFFQNDQICYAFSPNWPHTLGYAVILRIYFDPGKVDHPTGSIESPSSKSSVNDNPVFIAKAESDAGIQSVGFIGYYHDFDWEGNGVYRQWHYQTQKGVLKYHVGTAISSPYQVTWDTRYIPDQPKPMKFMARILDNNGIYYMSEAVTCIRLKRTSRSVQMGKPFDVPMDFSVGLGLTKRCSIEVPSNIAEAETAVIIIPSWSAHHPGESPGTEAKLNESYTVAKGFGQKHYYHYGHFRIWPPGLGTSGMRAAGFSVTSTTTHHRAEMCWPGPAAIVISPTPDTAMYCDTCESGCRIEVNVPDPVITPAGTTFTDSITIEIAQTSPSCSVFYTVNGGLPTRVSTPYTGPFVVKETAIINARAYSCTKLDSSNVVSVTFNLDVPKPTIEPSDTTFKDSIRVTITAPASVVRIHYTKDGSDPTRGSQEYDGPFVLKKSASVRARAYSKNGNDSSEVVGAVFTFWEDLQPPRISPRGGTFPDSVMVRLAGIGRACSLYFTVDGSEPTRSSALYAGSFALKGEATVKARAYSCDFSDSSLVSSFSFNITADIRGGIRELRVRRFTVKTVGDRVVLSLPHAGEYALDLYSPSGKRVGANRIKGPGLFNLQFGKLPPGIYVYRAISPSGRALKGKCVLMR